MGSGCNSWFTQRTENGLKKVDLLMPGCLQERRRELLQTARALCVRRDLQIPPEEVEAALIEGSWRRVLAPIERTSRTRYKLVRESVRVYNDTLWELKLFMDSNMIRGDLGAVRAFYALME